MPSVHFIGIGGVGMNGLAQLAALSGFSVGGSDRAYDPATDIFQTLEHLDIRIHPQDGSGISDSTTQLVYSTAIEKDNPDLLAAQARNLPLLHRAEFLKQLIGDAELIAVAGTAGKTTTTGMLGWIFECMGKDPSVYNGAGILNWKTRDRPGNIRKGRSNLWIIEADESDKSFLQFYPTHSIITNISKDHYELEELYALFNQFEAQTSGITIRGPFNNPEAHLKTVMLGKHNLENACAALQLCSTLGMDLDGVCDAIARFEGIERRLEIAGRIEDVTIIDDYAHNPAKISAALDAVREKYGRVHAYWRPHGFTPLLQGLEDLVDAFAECFNQHEGSLHILPVYYAGGTVERRVTSNMLVERLQEAGVPASLAEDYAILKKELERRAMPGDAILGMGARDPELPRFAKRLVAEWKKA